MNMPASKVAAMYALARTYEPNTDKGKMLVNCWMEHYPAEVEQYVSDIGGHKFVPAWVLAFHARGLSIPPKEES